MRFSFWHLVTILAVGYYVLLFPNGPRYIDQMDIDFGGGGDEVIPADQMVEIQGSVVSKKTKSSNNRKQFIVQYSFTVNRRTYIGSGDLANMKKWRAARRDDPITIIYDPGNPNTSRLK